MTMNEKKSSEATPLVELIEAVLQGTASDEHQQELQARLLANEAERKVYLHYMNLHAALRRQFAFDVDQDLRVQPNQAGAKLPSNTGRENGAAWFRIASLAAAVTIVLIASLYFLWPRGVRPIAKVTGLSGPLQWTGDGGQVSFDVRMGTELMGGTIEGLAPGSWIELEFSDGSTATISGNSMLTFSDDEQKKLHLKAGNLSSNVKPQPAGKPMLIYTRSAMLEVVGTQFEVEAETAATMLNVSEGSVRVTRFSDGNSVDVPARHRVIAAADREMRPVPVRKSVSQWKSELPLGPVRTQGKWSPRTDTQDAKLGAIPYTTPQGVTIYTTGFSVSWGDKPPVTMQPASRLRVRGRIASPHKVYFGVTVRQANGAFAGRFQTIRPVEEFAGGEEFDLILPLRDFRLDPSLASLQRELASDPFRLIVETIWCHTLDKWAGLEITEVELIPPGENAPS
jgi:ferric-dicitrate binding protein FerR (iron transport regulator)